MNVFVYGTLKRGERAAHMMLECVYVGEASIMGKIYALGGFPGVKLSHPSLESLVLGEVYELPSDEAARERIITRLDRYEGTPTLYQRKEVPCILLENGEEITVSTYEYVPEVREEWRLGSGCFTTIPVQEKVAYG